MTARFASADHAALAPSETEAPESGGPRSPGSRPSDDSGRARRRVQPRRVPARAPAPQRQPRADDCWTPALVARALDGDTELADALIRHIEPTIRRRARLRLVRAAGYALGRDITQEVDDMSQDSLACLLADDGRRLRSWDPERGLSLAGFAGLVADRTVLALLRTQRRSPWTEIPTADEALSRVADSHDAEDRAAARQLLDRMFRSVASELSPQGRTMLELLFVEPREVAEIQDRTGLTPDAIYAWRSRIRRALRRVAASLGEPTAA